MDREALAQMIRKCRNRDCTNLFRATRPHHRFCSDGCRTAYWKAQDAADQGRTRSVASRKPSRDGYGSRVYVTSPQLALLRVGLVPKGFASKLEAAAERMPQTVVSSESQ